MRASTVPTSTVSFFARVPWFFRVATTAWSRRRLVRQLAAFDDHLLRDIGLTRADIDSAMEGPGLGDPTLHLAARARETRSNRRASAMERVAWAKILGDTEALAAAETDRRAA